MNEVEIKKYDDFNWGFMYVSSRCEKKIAEKLQAQGYICYLPTIPHAYMMHYTKVVTQIPMLPSYVFICTNRDEATNLRYNEKQIVNVELLTNEFYENVFIKELLALKQCEELAKEKPILVNPGIQVGNKVLITQGRLKGLETDVIKRDDENNSIIINITILGQNVEYKVSADELKKITG